MRLDRMPLLAWRIGAAATMMSLACSSGSMKGGAGGGGGKGATGGSDTGAAGGGHPGSDGGTVGGAGGVGAAGHPAGGVGAAGHPAGGGGGVAGLGGGAGAGHPGGDGGSAAGGGSGGTAGADGGLIPSPLEFPGCLSDLLSACSAGARATITSMLSTGYPNGDCGNFTVVTVWKPDGSLCYTFEEHDPIAYDCSRALWTWKDPTGRIVATGTHDTGYRSKGQITCAWDDAATTCTGATCCGVSEYGSPACPDGVNVLRCSAGTCP
jgi:hypothetical protein